MALHLCRRLAQLSTFGTVLRSASALQPPASLFGTILLSVCRLGISYVDSLLRKLWPNHEHRLKHDFYLVSTVKHSRDTSTRSAKLLEKDTSTLRPIPSSLFPRRFWDSVLHMVSRPIIARCHLVKNRPLRRKKSTTDLHKSLKNIELTMRGLKFIGEDPVLVLDFLTRVFNESDTLGMSERQLIVFIAHLRTKNDAENFRSSSSFCRSGS